ncbi:MAG: hypothetical protein U0667_07655 [Chloroflexota bacterium]
MDPAIGPGDVRPRHLERPPGERYRAPSVPVREHPDLARGLLLGVVVALVVALVAGLLRSILDVTLGLVVVAGAGGWLVGAAVRRGAWSGLAHRPSPTPEVLGLSLGAAAWVAALVSSWLVAMAILPGSARSFPDRLAATPFLDWLGPQVGLLDLLCLVLAAVLGWMGARSAATASSA